jgi:cell division protein FtsW (lipid II flippase)
MTANTKSVLRLWILPVLMWVAMALLISFRVDYGAVYVALVTTVFVAFIFGLP